jgi:hypothetical protein
LTYLPSVTARSKVLLEVILDAFKTVFEVLVLCAIHLDAEPERRNPAKSTFKQIHEEQVMKACNLLDTAKDRLIAEADEIVYDKRLGPVVSSEAIIIMLLERLSNGVYNNGTADIMELYEKIVETIVGVSTTGSLPLLTNAGLTS